MRWWFFITLLWISGCYTTVTELKTEPPAKIAKILNHHLLPDAYSAIECIPTVEGYDRTFVSGVNIWSNLGAFFTLNGWGRKVITNDHLSIGTLIHEYVHHLDDLDRDGFIDLIDHDEFEVALQKLSLDKKYRDMYEDIVWKSDRWVTNWFGIGDLSEEIAYTAEWLVYIRPHGPDYMWNVFRKVLKR